MLGQLLEPILSKMESMDPIKAKKAFALQLKQLYPEWEDKTVHDIADTSWVQKSAISFSLAYLVQPNDFIPDHLPGYFGYVDDVPAGDSRSNRIYNPPAVDTRDAATGVPLIQSIRWISLHGREQHDSQFRRRGRMFLHRREHNWLGLDHLSCFQTSDKSLQSSIYQFSTGNSRQLLNDMDSTQYSYHMGVNRSYIIVRYGRK